MNITTANDQKLLLAVSFGTSFADTRENTIGAIERRIAERFPDCTIQRCFTSRMIRKKLLERDGLKIYSPEEAMQKALEKGIRELIVQPLYLMHGFEHRRLMETIREAASSFDKPSSLHTTERIPALSGAWISSSSEEPENRPD